MPERVIMLPASRPGRHRRSSGVHRTIDVAARAGSLVTLGSLLALAGAAVVTAAPGPAPERVVTFEIAGHR
jgi:hypothetical protein